MGRNAEMEALFLMDPVVAAPLLVCLLMGASSGLLGVWLFFQRQQLIGEVLSHSLFPGMVIGSIIFSLYEGFNSGPHLEMLFIFLFGSCTAYLGHFIIEWLVRKKYASQDGALAYVLSSTFGIGLFAISIVQTEYPSLWRKLSSLLMGQAATITYDAVLPAFCALLVSIGAVVIYRRAFLSFLFDQNFAKIHGLMPRLLGHLVPLAIVAVSILGIRIMGVVLMSAILTFPPVIARMFSDRIGVVTLLSVLFGAFSCFFGVLISHSCSTRFVSDVGRSLWLPTGPLIVLFMVLLLLVTLFFGTRHGLLVKLLRKMFFQLRCTRENTVKNLWKFCVATDTSALSWSDFRKVSPWSFSSFSGVSSYWLLRWSRYIVRTAGGVIVTEKGLMEGRRLVRLHRLWELYLVEYCGMDRTLVHPSAEEMEHIITQDMERELSLLLNDACLDPHKQPIPEKSRMIEK